MPSIIPGYEYDIFISYRHNDNKSGWVTEFVAALEEELASTIKEPLTIYFDKNPHDGLLETHNVDKSLEGKLKSLILIPIISQTYCDPKSFAWTHEFIPFNKSAKEDRFGRDVKLGNGNVASRILPIRIHELDEDDKSIIENEMGGPVRAIEFIYKSGGVNRPLHLKDDDLKIPGNVLYRDQVNKVANAVKNIMVTLRNPDRKPQPASAASVPRAMPASRKVAIFLFALLLIAIAGIAYQKSRSDNPPVLEKSIAVLPFADMSASHDQEYFGDGVAEEIINVLAQSDELKVIARTSSFQFKGKNEDLKKIGELLGVSNILEGSIRKSANQLRITAQLINTKDGSHIWSKTFDRSADDILALQDEIAMEVARAFKLTVTRGGHSTAKSARNADAYNAYLQGRYYYDTGTLSGDPKAIEFFTKSIMLDSTFGPAWVELASTKWRMCAAKPTCADWPEIIRMSLKGIELDPGYAGGHASLSVIYRSELKIKESYEEIIKAYALDPKDPRTIRNYALMLLTQGKDDEAIDLCNKAVALDPIQSVSYRYLGRMYYYAGRFPKAFEAFKKSYDLSQTAGSVQTPDYPMSIVMAQSPGAALDFSKSEKSEKVRLVVASIAYFTKGNLVESDNLLNELIRKYESEIPYHISLVYAFRKDRQRTIQWLNKAYDRKEYGINLMDRDPALTWLHNDPEFRQIVAKLNIPQ
jgi:adenylate cyclase